MKRSNGNGYSSAIACVLILSHIGIAEDCNNDCAIITHQGMPGPGATSTNCGMYTPGHARASTINWSPNGDPTKQKSLVAGKETTYTLTNLNTCSLRCQTQTQSYGFSDAALFVINDPELEVVSTTKYPLKECKAPAT